MTNTKQEQYAEQKVRLKRALYGAFYYEAILIEYAMFEDRSASVLSHVGCKTHDKRGNPIGLSKKLDVINDNPSFQIKFIKQRLSRDLIEKIRDWKNSRDVLVHNLMNIPTGNSSEAKEVAENGNELLRLFDNKVNSVNHYLEKKDLKE